MPEPLAVDGASLDLHTIARFLEEPGLPVALASAARERVVRAARTVEEIVASGRAVYGINTGFGRLADKRIAPDKVRDLQRNLVRSHCCGVGDPLSAAETRLLILLRANALAKGLSGIRPETLELLLELVNRGVLPVIPEKGSVGASGDLAPLAHLAVVLIGEGEALFRGERLPGAEALARAGLAPVELAAKEGLSLINGTQMMTAIGAKAAVEARRLFDAADIVCAMTIDALEGTDAAFDARIHEARPHPGQIASARNLRRLLRGSEVRESHRGGGCTKVQDAYSLRCAPQVHGAARDALRYVEEVLEREINAATDNPLVFAEDGEALSGGNFHGQPVSFALDVLAIAVSEIGAISERRVERLVNPDYSGLPPFLIRGQEGLESGFMMAQVTAAALTSENKVFCHPASVDSIPTSAGFEDHVSMGVTAALKARECLRNVEAVVAIELIAAAQALEFRRPLSSSPALEAVHALVREHVEALWGDRPLSGDIARAAGLIRGGHVRRAALAALDEPLG
jgi:histidine ammonia-lyase